MDIVLDFSQIRSKEDATNSSSPKLPQVAHVELRWAEKPSKSSEKDPTDNQDDDVEIVVCSQNTGIHLFDRSGILIAQITEYEEQPLRSALIFPQNKINFLLEQFWTILHLNIHI